MSWGNVAGAAVGLIGGALSKRSANKGIDKATAASEQAAREANQLQREMWERSEQKAQPFYDTGVAANSMLTQLLGIPQQQAAPQQPTQGGGILDRMQGGGLPNWRGGAGVGMRMEPGQVQSIGQGGWNPGGTSPTPSLGGVGTGGPAQVQQSPEQLRQSMFDLWRSTPGYQFNLDEGNRGVQSSAAARGGLYSGATAKALTRFNQNYADRTYGDYTNALRLAAGQGQLVSSQSGQMGMNYAGNVGNNLINAGNTRASGLLQKGQNNADFTAGAFGMVNRGLNNWSQFGQWGNPYGT